MFCLLVLASFLFLTTNMATMEYGKYRLDSRPQRHDEVEGWFPFVSISWLDGREWRYHNIEDRHKIFDNEEEALTFGFAVARIWINEER